MILVRVCFGTNERMLSKLMRWLTRSNVTHVWLEYECLVWSGIWAAHVTERGAIKEHHIHVRSKYRVCEVFEPLVELTGVISMGGLIGVAGYDYRNAIWNGLLFLLYRFTKWHWLYKFTLRRMCKLTCSEFVAWIFKASDLKHTEQLEPELTMVGDLAKFCKNSDEFRRVEESSW